MTDQEGSQTPLTPWLLRRVSQRFRDAIRAALDSAGFGDVPQQGFWALAALGRQPGEASELVAEMDITKQAVSKLVETLVRAGYVSRGANDEDRRRTRLLLTPRGRRAAEVIRRAVVREEHRMEAELGTGGLEGLRAALLVLTGSSDNRRRA